MMTPSKFSKFARQSGLDRPGCGLAAIDTLKKLVSEPSQSKKMCRATRHKAPSPLPHVSALIRNGFAVLSSGQYEPTPSGKDWLAKITTMIEKKHEKKYSHTRRSNY
jgi:hypothetical protein